MWEQVNRPDAGMDRLFDVSINVTFRLSALDLDEAMALANRIGFVQPARSGGVYVFPVIKAVSAQPTNTAPVADVRDLLRREAEATRDAQPFDMGPAGGN